MSVTRWMIGLAVAASLGLSGCSSNKNKMTALSAGKALKAVLTGPKPRLDPARLSRAAAEALAKTDDERLVAIQFPTVKGQSVLRVIESNGPYDTWAAWGTTDRRTVTTKRGIITATRSVPPDLMSADVDEVLRLVTRREEGTAVYAQRYLDGNHKIVEAKSTCVVTRGYDKLVEYGEIRQPALQMFSSCVSADRQFVDLFLVGEDGRILQSRQWVGPVVGFAVMQHLR